MKLPDARTTVFALGMAVLAAIPLTTGYAGWRWELAEAAGWFALLVCVGLAGAAIRPRRARPETLLTLARHEWLAWCALMASLLHVVVALLAEPLVFEYLKPTLPRYQLAGLIGFVLLLALVAISLNRARRRLWHNHRAFQASHIVMSAALLLLLGLHVVGSDRYTHGPFRRGLFLAVMALALLLPLRRSRFMATAPSTQRPRSAFGRHARVVTAALVSAAVLLLAFAPTPWARSWREPFVARAHRLPLDFDHARHTVVNCLECHHNYTDGTGMDTCVQCHRKARADLHAGVEATFHEFCMRCHRSPPSGLRGHGPVSGCAACHQSPRQP